MSGLTNEQVISIILLAFLALPILVYGLWGVWRRRAKRHEIRGLKDGNQVYRKWLKSSFHDSPE